MSEYNFEGDISGITEQQLQFINKIIIDNGFENSKVTFEPVGKAGDNYVASVKRIIIEGENGTLNMIAKIAPTHEIMRMMMNTLVLFRNEHIMYTEVLPKLVELQKNAGIPEEEQLRYAKCYGSFSEAPNEVILLEDLNLSQFSMLDRFASLSNECVKSVLKNFAILHSLSFVLKQKEPETFDYYKSNLLDLWSLLSTNEESKMYFQGLEMDVLAALDDPEHVNLVRHKVGTVTELAAKLAKIEYNSKHSIIQQGDSWTNNIMFRFEENEVAASIMIDYQLSKNTSPVCDIMYMIFNCTDHATRKNNYNDWIDYYHSELDNSLSNFNLKANFIYPRDQLDADLKRYGKLMFGLSVVLASMLIRKSDDAAKAMELMQKENALEFAHEMSVTQLDEESKELFKNRILGLIYSFTEFGLM